MEKETIQKALNELKEKSQKRKFTQTIDLIVNLKELNLKNPQDQVDFFALLNFDKGRKTKVCALIGPELKDEAEKFCDTVITVDQFPQYAEKKKLRKLAEDHDFFLGQSDMMTKIAQVFGRVLGVRNKMPNPKGGCVIVPKTPLGPLCTKLQKTIRISAKTSPSIKCAVAKESMKEEEILDNILTLYNQIVHHLPKEENNVKNVFLKMTMSKPVKVK